MTLDPAAPEKPLGRTPHAASKREAVRAVVAAELKRQGYSAGRGSVAAALSPRPPLRLIQESLRTLKAEHRAARRKEREERRVSVIVHMRDAIWAEDATHLTRDEHGGPVQAEVIRDAATTKTVGLEVGPPTTTESALDLLERSAAERGAFPLVKSTDNGAPYTSTEYEKRLEELQIVHLKNVPHTPEHNPVAEHANGELKAEVDLGENHVAILERDLIEARERLDTCRLRASRGFLTAVQCDSIMPRASDHVDRKEFYRRTRSAIEAAVRDLEGARAQCLATREAIFATLEDFGVITRTRGGVPITRPLREIIS